jgi:hypothetical protein
MPGYLKTPIFQDLNNLSLKNDDVNFPCTPNIPKQNNSLIEFNKFIKNPFVYFNETLFVLSTDADGIIITEYYIDLQLKFKKSHEIKTPLANKNFTILCNKNNLCLVYYDTSNSNFTVYNFNENKFIKNSTQQIISASTYTGTFIDSIIDEYNTCYLIFAENLVKIDIFNNNYETYTLGNSLNIVTSIITPQFLFLFDNSKGILIFNIKEGKFTFKTTTELSDFNHLGWTKYFDNTYYSNLENRKIAKMDINYKDEDITFDITILNLTDPFGINLGTQNVGKFLLNSNGKLTIENSDGLIVIEPRLNYSYVVGNPETNFQVFYSLLTNKGETIYITNQIFETNNVCCLYSQQNYPNNTNSSILFK